MAQARELDYPRFASEIGASVVEPNEGRKDIGFEADDEADEAEFNWLHRTTYRWARFLDESHCGREFRGTTSWYEPAFGYVAGAGLTAACGPGVVCREGTRLELDAAWLLSIGEDDHTFPASRDTYVFVDDERALTFSDVANGGPAPATPPDTTLLFIVVTDGANVTSVTRSLLDGPIMAPTAGLRVSPQLITGLSGGVPTHVFDVGIAGAGATMESIRSAVSGGLTYYDRTWTRATNRVTEILAGAGAHVSADGSSDATTKTWQWALGHYTNAEEPVGLVRGVSGVATSTVMLGGGAASVNAATSVQLWAAANVTTTTGTMLLEVQGTTSLVYMPVGLVTLGDGSGVPLLRLNRGSGGGMEGGIEVQEAGSRRWLANYSPNNSDDLVWWRFNGGADNGVAFRLNWTNGDATFYHSLAVEADESDDEVLEVVTHIGAEGGALDDNRPRIYSRVGQTNTNGNEDIVIGDPTRLGILGGARDKAAACELLVCGMEEADSTAIYVRRFLIVLSNPGGGASIAGTVEDTTHASADFGGWDVACSAAPTMVGSELRLRVTATDVLVRNWTILVRSVPTSAAP